MGGGEGLGRDVGSLEYSRSRRRETLIETSDIEICIFITCSYIEINSEVVQRGAVKK